MVTRNVCLKCGASLGDGARVSFCSKCLFLAAGGALLDPNPDSIGPGEEGGPVGFEHSGWTATPVELPASFGDYELLQEIGRGGMGVVYCARQSSLDRVVAIKMMSFGPHSSPDLIKRFQAEAVAAASLHHPNIVAIHEVGVRGDQHFFVMDHIDGQNLAKLLGNFPLAGGRAAGYLKTVAEAIHYAHERGILHRDLKPSNVLIDMNDQPHVVDFGLARRLEGDSELTLTGQVLGSPNYLSPEQASVGRARVSRRTDVYALGATFYQLLTGRPPFQAESLAQTLDLVLHTESVSPRLLNPGIPRDLETICLKCLEKEPSRRYGTAQELAEELGRFLNNEPIRARPLGTPARTWRWCRRNPALAGAVGAAVVSLLAGFVGVTWQWQRAEREALVAEQNAYAADMKEAQHALDESDMGRARELLDLYSPLSGATRAYGHPPSSDLRGWEWRYLWSRCQSEESFTLCQYSNAVSALVFSPDGKWLVVRREDGTMAYWDAVRRTCREEMEATAWKFDARTLACASLTDLLAWGCEGSTGQGLISFGQFSERLPIAPLLHPGLVRSVALSPNGTTIAAMAEDGAVRIWDFDSRRLVNNWPFTKLERLDSQPFVPQRPQPHFDSNSFWSDRYGRVLFSPDGRWLAVGEFGAHIRLLDPVTGKQRSPIPLSLPGDGVTAMAFSPDSRHLAAGCGVGDSDVHVWDLETGRERRLRGHSGWISVLAFSPDGQTLASAGADQTIRLWDVARQSEQGRFHGATDEILALAWSPDGKELVSGGKDGVVRYWDPAAESASRCAVLPEFIKSEGYAFFPDSMQFLTVSRSNGLVVRWDTGSVRPVELLDFLGTNHSALDLSPDGRLLALGDQSGSIHVWDLPARQVVRHLTLSDTEVVHVRFSSRGNLLLGGAVVANGLYGKIWKVADWQEISVEGIRLEAGVWPALSPDEHTLAIGYWDGTAAWWDLNTRERTAFFEFPEHGSHGVAFSPDGRWFLTGGLDDGRLTLWDTRTRKPKYMGRPSRNGVQAMVFSPDSRRFAVCGTRGEGVITIWDTQTGRELIALPSTFNFVNHLAFSPNGNCLMAASIEGTALLWHAPSFEEIARRESGQRQ